MAGNTPTDVRIGQAVPMASWARDVSTAGRLVAAALLAVVLAGCTGSGSSGTAASSAPGDRSVSSEPPATNPQAAQTLTLVVDRTEAAVGGSITVTGTGCVSPSGDGTLGTMGVGIPNGPSADPTVAPDGSFTGTFPVTDLTPPGDQQVTATCFGPMAAAWRACNCNPDGATGPGAGLDFFLTAPPTPIHISGATVMAVSPTQTRAGGVVQVRVACKDPRSDYEYVSAWITPVGDPTPRPFIGDATHPGAHCTSPKTTVDLTVDPGLAPGRYVVHAATADELTPVIRWFQPVEIEVVAP